MTEPNHIPATLEDLHSWDKARGWERAALVYAWTEPQQGERTDLGHNGPKLSLTDFADLGIGGLTKRHTVAWYRKQWSDHAAKKYLSLKPGDPMPKTWPKTKWPPSPRGTDGFSSPDGAKATLAKIARDNPEAFTELVAEDEAVRDVTTTAVAADHTATVSVMNKHDEAHTKKPTTRQPPTVVDGALLLQQVENLVLKLEDKWPEVTGAIRGGSVPVGDGLPTGEDIISDWAERLTMLVRLAEHVTVESL